MRKTIPVLVLLTLVSTVSDAQSWLFPGKKKRAAETVEVIATPVRDTITETAPPVVDSACAIPVIIPDRIRVALELPLGSGLTGIDGNLFDFYCGALLAARDLGNEGIAVDLEVLDTRSPVSPARTGRGIHAVVGPINSNEILAAVSTESDSCLYFVSPLDPKAAALTDSFRIVQTPTPASVQAEVLAEWIASELQVEDRVLVVRQSGEAPDEFSESVLNELARRNVAYSTLTYNILEALEIPEKYAGLASVTGITRVFAASASESFTGDVVRNINLLQYKERKGILYCNSRVRSFPGIETANLHSAMTRMVANYNVDYSSSEVNRFVMAYRALFRCEPGSFAFQGYDVLHYVCKTISRFGTIWYEKLPEYSESGLQSDFSFEPSGKPGKVNRGVRRLIYNPDFSISVQQ